MKKILFAILLMSLNYFVVEAQQVVIKIKINDNIKDKQGWAIKLMLLTKGAKRGYIEKQEHTVHLQPFTHIEIEQKFDNYEEIKPENNGRISKESGSKE